MSESTWLKYKMFGSRMAKGEGGQEKVAQSQCILEVILDFILKIRRHYLMTVTKRGRGNDLNFRKKIDLREWG